MTEFMNFKQPLCPSSGPGTPSPPPPFDHASNSSINRFRCMLLVNALTVTAGEDFLLVHFACPPKRVSRHPRAIAMTLLSLVLISVFVDRLEQLWYFFVIFNSRNMSCFLFNLGWLVEFERLRHTKLWKWFLLV